MSDTGPAKLPGIPVLQSGNAALDAWAQAVKEHLEVRSGSRGNAAEKVLTQRDLDSFKTTGSTPVGVDSFVDKLLSNSKFQATIGKKVTVSTSTDTESTSSDITRADLDRLSRRISAMSKGGGYGDGFEFVGGKWQIKGGVQMNPAITVAQLLDMLAQVLYLDTALTHSVGINHRLVVSGTNVSLYDLVVNILNLKERLPPLEWHFDGTNRLIREHLPLILGAYDMHDTIVNMNTKLDYLKVHTGYSGPW